MNRGIKILVLLFFISGCGLRPLYSINNQKTVKELSQIEVSSINSIEGAEFLYKINSILPSKTVIKYKLNVSLKYSESHGIIQKNSDVLRENRNLFASYSLVDISSGTVITSGSFTKLSSRSNTFSPYENTLKGQDSFKYLAYTAAEEIRNRLILFFEHQK